MKPPKMEAHAVRSVVMNLFSAKNPSALSKTALYFWTAEHTTKYDEFCTNSCKNIRRLLNRRRYTNQGACRMSV